MPELIDTGEQGVGAHPQRAGQRVECDPVLHSAQKPCGDNKMRVCARLAELCAIKRSATSEETQRGVPGKDTSSAWHLPCRWWLA